MYGASLATNITYILNMLITDCFIRYKQHTDFRDMIFFYDRSCFTNLWNYLKIGIPGMLMLCFEWWAFELLAIFTGLLGVSELAAEVVIINMISFIFMLPLGISYSASALTGNSLGEGKIALAKKYAAVSVGLSTILMSIIVFFLVVFEDQVTSFFTNDAKVNHIIKQTMWVVVVYIWCDQIHGVQSGIIRGLGRQVYGSVFTLFCYYAMGMPFALFLCFKMDMGIAGLWLGFTVCCVILDAGFFLIIY